MASYSVRHEKRCPQCGKATLYCEFDDGLPSASGDCVFAFTHTCSCGYHKSVSHLIGHDQEGSGDWDCAFCSRDWLRTSSEIDEQKRRPSVEGAAPNEDKKQKEVDDIYQTRQDLATVAATVADINSEFKRYLAAHPDKLHSLSPRRFEELIADILKHFGFDVELTQATRDGGKDIYAYIRNRVCSLLMFVECKRYSLDRRVGIDAVQRLYGVQQSHKANKSMIVTTSFFTMPAIKEASKYESLMSLRDYEDLKKWLVKYTES